MTASRQHTAVAIASLVAVAIALLWIVQRDTPYHVSGVFDSAGQLIEGGAVQVAGRKVGTISKISLTDDGRAEIELAISDGDVAPLHEGTRLAIRAIGQAGIANRYVDVAPGDDRAPELRDGAVIPQAQTRGIVDLDQLLNTFDRPTRDGLQGLLARSDELFAGSGAASFNSMLRRLTPAVQQVQSVAEQIAGDRRELRSLLSGSATAARAVASRRTDLEAAVANTAQGLGALAGQRRALSSVLARAPGVLGQAKRTLRGVDATVGRLEPTLRAVPPAARPAADVLGRTTRMLTAARPVVRELDRQSPGLARALDGLRPLAGPAVTALGSTRRSLRDAAPIVSALRAYGPDFILGIFNGLAGVATGGYDASGHYARLEFVQSPQTLLGGANARLLSSAPLLPNIIDVRKKLTARCPGGAAPPAPDGSNPWITPDAPCDPAQSISGDVNRP